MEVDAVELQQIMNHALKKGIIFVINIQLSKCP